GLQGKGSDIEGHEGGRELEAALELRLGKSAGGPPERGNGQIGRESGGLTNPIIQLMLETNGIRFPVIAAPGGNLGAGLGVALEEGIDQGPLLRGNQDPASNSPDALHDDNISSSCVRLGPIGSGTSSARAKAAAASVPSIL